MATAPIMRKKNAVYQQNAKRGLVKTAQKDESFKLPVAYWTFGILVFALVGGAVLQIVNLIIEF